MSFTDITSCKVTKVTEATTTKQAYVKNADGTQGMVDINNNATAQSIVLRDNAGRTYVTAGAEEGQAVNVKQMNSAIATAMEVGTSGLERTDNKVTAITGEGSDVQYPSTKAVVDYVAANAGEAYRVDITATSGLLTGEQFEKLKADPRSYIVLTTSSKTVVYYQGRVEDNSMYYHAGHNSNTTNPGQIDLGELLIQRPGGTGNAEYNDLSDKAQSVRWKVTNISSSSTNDQYPSAKATYDADQATLTAAKSYADSILGAEQVWLQKIDSGEGV